MPASHWPRVAVIVLNFNGAAFMRDCFRSLLALDYPAAELELVCVDNASSDDSLEVLARDFLSVRVIASERNLGFAAGNNLAARQVDTPYIALLNNDMRVEPGWLKALVEPARRDPRPASVAGKILHWDGEKLDFVNGDVNWYGHAWQVDEGEASSPRDRAGPLLFACGGNCLFDREIFLAHGGFDEDYLLFFEDVDLGWRLWLAGENVVYTPQALAYHHHHGSARQVEPHRLRVLYERNALFTIYKCYESENLARTLLPAVLLTNKKGLEMAGVDWSLFAFGGETRGQAVNSGPPPEAAGPRMRRRLGEAWQAAGPMGAGARLAGAGGRALERRLLPPDPPPFPPDSVPVRLLALSHWLAIDQFAASLGRLNQKRADVQARRRRSDAELFALFKDPYQPTFGGIPFSSRQGGLEYDFAIREIFSGLPRDPDGHLDVGVPPPPPLTRS